MSECIFCGKPATHYVDYTEPMGDGYDTVCGDHAGKLSESMMETVCREEQPAAGAGPLTDDRFTEVWDAIKASDPMAIKRFSVYHVRAVTDAVRPLIAKIRTEARRAALEEAARHIEFNPPHNTGHVARATAANEIRELRKKGGEGRAFRERGK